MPLDNRKKKKVTIEEVEAVKPEVVETPEIVAEVPQEEVKEEVKEVVQEEVPTEPVQEVKEPVQEPAPEIDYKEKFSESSREAMSLHFKNEKLNSLLSNELDVPVPTDDELRVYAKDNGAEYDELDVFSKNILRRTMITERREAERVKAYEEIRKIDTWAKKVDDYIASEENIAKYPSLEGQEDEFKKFCMKDTQRGVDFNLLVASFLYENEKIPEQKKKGAMFLSRGNGRVEAPKPMGISASEAEVIRTTDPKEYRRLIKSGKIKIEI